jgi:hypothetical protein
MEKLQPSKENDKYLGRTGLFKETKDGIKEVNIEDYKAEKRIESTRIIIGVLLTLVTIILAVIY